MAQQRVAFQGLPARICWLGYGDRAKAGALFNELVASGRVSAPIVIGRDHLDCGSVASPNRETEGMRDGSDAIGDWPVLNALLNAVNGATWVSFHHGGGVGIGYSLHAGMVIVADGTDAAEKRLRRVLTTDPGMGVVRHVDAGPAQVAGRADAAQQQQAGRVDRAGAEHVLPAPDQALVRAYPGDPVLVGLESGRPRVGADGQVRPVQVGVQVGHGGRRADPGRRVVTDREEAGGLWERRRVEVGEHRHVQRLVSRLDKIHGERVALGHGHDSYRGR
jgi:hypothetical protein